uniref:ATP synthase F0 subunit 8 n=1 Tax=Micrura ignea TaxID=328822 RepID=A0A0D5NSY9_9BILA|nr:ATP synthase F0 subunit 8 [Micrura ignea]AJY78577.1 ATP synthase F0 subunit 8 [Micrura ignea]
MPQLAPLGWFFILFLFFGVLVFLMVGFWWINRKAVSFKGVGISGVSGPVWKW